MNTWNFSGEIVNHGVKGQKFPKLWLQVLLPSVYTGSNFDNKFFINFDVDPNTSSRAGKLYSYVSNKLKTDRFFFLSDATIAFVQVSKKLPDGSWENEDVIGVKGKLGNLCLSSNRFDNINMGIAEGKVSSWTYDNQSNQEKFIVDDIYRNVKTGEMKTRIIPILNENPPAAIDLTNKKVFTAARISGVTLDGQSKIHCVSKNLIVMQ